MANKTDLPAQNTTKNEAKVVRSTKLAGTQLSELCIFETKALPLWGRGAGEQGVSKTFTVHKAVFFSLPKFVDDVGCGEMWRFWVYTPPTDGAVWRNARLWTVGALSSASKESAMAGDTRRNARLASGFWNFRIRQVQVPRTRGYLGNFNP
jgi:hypothetical protein